MAIRFGTSGIPTGGRTTNDGVALVAELGLDCMELAFVQGVRLSEKDAEIVRATAEARDVELTVHAPYYVNLNAHEPEKIAASKERIIGAAARGSIAGARNIVFHPAFYLGDPPEDVYLNVRDSLLEIRERLDEQGLGHIILRPETTGKPPQFGTLDELIQLSTDVPGVLPCVDFSHLHARMGGGSNDIESFRNVLKQIGDTLGPDALGNMHIHLSGIEFTPKGERRHVFVKDSDMNWKDVLRALIEFEADGRIICEGPNPEVDAKTFKETYMEMLNAESMPEPEKKRGQKP